MANLIALLKPETSVLIQKRHSYTRSLNLETSGDRINVFLHCGDVLVLFYPMALAACMFHAVGKL